MQNDDGTLWHFLGVHSVEAIIEFVLSFSDRLSGNGMDIIQFFSNNIQLKTTVPGSMAFKLLFETASMPYVIRTQMALKDRQFNIIEN